MVPKGVGGLLYGGDFTWCSSIGCEAGNQKKLKKAGAFSEDTAKKPEEICASEKWLRMRGVKRTDDGRYYIECEDKKHC
jgi:hypothetical protein